MREIVTVVIDYRAQPGKRGELRAALATLIRRVVETEEDCLGIEMLEDQDDDSRLLLYERWTSREAYVGRHLQTPHISAFRAQAPAFAAGPPSITFWRTTDDLKR
jgi:quinol monooxygenase YgiN